MPPRGKTDLAHPQAADWVLGTLGPDETAAFRLHLGSCPHCQAAVAEFRELGQLLRQLPPAAELPPGLEARTITSVLAAVAEDRTPTRIHRVPTGLTAAAQREGAAEVHDVPGPAAASGATSPHWIPPAVSAPAVSPETGPASEPGAVPEPGAGERPGGPGAKIIRFPRWRGRTGLLTIASAVAAAILAAVIVLPRLGGGLPADALAFRLASPTGQAASGTVTARQDPSGSWNITLTVAHLKHFGDTPWYECWYVDPAHRKVASAGTFIVPASGGGTFTMTSAVDPHDFSLMEIRVESPDGTGARQGTVVLSGRATKA
jgi:hypothetical protein